MEDIVVCLLSDQISCTNLNLYPHDLISFTEKITRRQDIQGLPITDYFCVIMLCVFKDNCFWHSQANNEMERYSPSLCTSYITIYVDGQCNISMKEHSKWFGVSQTFHRFLDPWKGLITRKQTMLDYPWTNDNPLDYCKQASIIWQCDTKAYRDIKLEMKTQFLNPLT